MILLSIILVATTLAQSSIEPTNILHKGGEVTQINTKIGTCSYLGLKRVTGVDVPLGYGLEFFDNYDCSGLTVATGLKGILIPKRNVADIRSVKIVDEFKIIEQLTSENIPIKNRLNYNENFRPKRVSMDYYSIYDNGYAPKLPW